LGHAGEAIRDHLPKMAALPNSANTDLKKAGITYFYLWRLRIFSD
jgi:hypothetical protein